MRRELLIGTVLIALTGVAAAATPKGKEASKPKAPTAQPSPSLEVVGLKFGSEFTLAECPLDPPLSSFMGPRYKYPHEMKDAMPCFKQGFSPKPGYVLDRTYASVDVVIDQLPDGVRQDFLTVKVIEGRIEGVSMATYGLKFQEGLLELLTEKFGKPTVVNRSKVQNRMGAEFDQVDAEWKFTDLTVMFLGMGSKIDMGIIDISTPTAEAIATAKREEAKAAAPKF